MCLVYKPTELFFDLVFVYAISQTVGLIHHLHHGIVEPIQFIRYVIAMTALVSMWCIHTFYVNRYSDHSVRDTLFLMGNMLLVMMFSNTINVDWGQSYAMSFGTLSLIVFSVIAQNLWRYFESKPGPARTVNLTYASILMINGIGFLTAAFIPTFSSALTVGVAGLVIPWGLYPWVGRKAIQKYNLKKVALTTTFIIREIIIYAVIACLAWFVKDNSTYLLWTTAVVTGWIAWQTHKRALLIEKHH